MIVVRSLSGALNGNVAVVKASLGDITDDSNSTEAFALYGLTWTVGSILGNSLGGYLSHPYERWPEVFGEYEIYRIHPYLLPCLVSAGLCLAGVIFTALFFKESLPAIVDAPNKPSAFSLKMFSNNGHKRSQSSVSVSGMSIVSDTDTLVESESPDSPSTERLLSKMPGGTDDNGFGVKKKGWTFMELMKHRPVQILSVTMFLNQFVGGGWAAGSLLFFFDRHNGLGMSANAIGTAFAVNGFWSIFVQLAFLSRFRQWLGISLAYKVLSLLWVPVWMVLPLLRPLLEASEDPLPKDDPSDFTRYAEVRGWTVSIGVNLLLSFVTLVGMSNSLLMVLVNYSSPDKSALGAVNGISTAVGCMSRVLGPSSVSALFAISMDRNLLGGRLWWIFMVVMSFLSWISCLFISKDPRPPRELESIEEEEEPPEDTWEFETPTNGKGQKDQQAEIV